MIPVIIAFIAGIYLFALGMGVPLPPKDFKGSKATAAGGLLVIVIAAALIPVSAPSQDTPAGRVATEMKKTVKLPSRREKGLSVVDIFGDGDTLVYVFRIEKENETAKSHAARMGEEVKKSACQQEDFITMLKQGINVKYSYQDKNGKPAGKTVITPGLCRL